MAGTGVRARRAVAGWAGRSISSLHSDTALPHTDLYPLAVNPSFLGHRLYGSMGFSYYHTIPGRDTKRKIFIVFNPLHTSKICKERRDVRPSAPARSGQKPISPVLS